MKDHHIIEKIISFTEENDASFSPILGEDDSIMRHEQSYLRDISPVDEIPSSYIKNIATKIKRSAGAKKILKLDIANCFSSFYMHMIPSIVLGYDTAMEQYHRYLDNFQDTTIDSEYLIFNGLDEAIRRQNLNQTNGLLPGILSSKIIMEGMLTRIDHELQDKGLHFSRYMDDYEVYLFDDSEKPVISVFTQVLRKYGFSLNFEKTEIIDFPYYIAQNLERIFQSYSTDTELLSEDLMELFNSFMNLESAGTKGAIRYLLKSLEKKPITPQDPLLYQAYLLTVLENNERSLTKACSLLISNKTTLTMNSNDIQLIKRMLQKHLSYGHDLEVLWLLYLLIETNNIDGSDEIISEIVSQANDLSKIVLLRKELLSPQHIDSICSTAVSWILLYELYAMGHIDEDTFVRRLKLDKNKDMYNYFKNNGIHFCYG